MKKRTIYFLFLILSFLPGIASAIPITGLFNQDIYMTKSDVNMDSGIISSDVKLSLLDPSDKGLPTVGPTDKGVPTFGPPDEEVPTVCPVDEGLPGYSQEGGTAPAPVPEPATLLLLSSGLLGIAASRRKFKRK